MVLVSDFDKTLFDENYENNVKAVNEFVKKGNIFIIATGRSISNLKKDLKKDLNFSYIICNNGAMIFDHDFNLIYRKDIIDIYIEKIFITLKKSVYVGNPLIDLGYGFRGNVCLNANIVFARIIDYDNAKKLVNQLLKKYPKVSVYISDGCVCFTDKSVNKASSLKKLSKILKVKPRHMYIIGDNINDISMCKIGKGFSVENGNEELKKVCKKTVKSVEELVNSL